MHHQIYVHLFMIKNTKDLPLYLMKVVNGYSQLKLKLDYTRLPR
jgi:hypothetical protein